MKRRGKSPSKSKGIGIGIRSLIPSIMFPAGTSSTAAFVSTMPRSQTATTGNILDPSFMPKPSAVVASDYTASTTAGTESSIVSDLSSDDSDLILLNGKSLRQTLNVDTVDPDKLNRQPWIVGHRGCLYQELENTRMGFQKCAEMGADAVELDVFLLKCGNLIVFHGAGSDKNPGQLFEYCGVEGSILDLTYEEALQLSFDPNSTEFPCPEGRILAGRIPTLEQVLLDAKESGLHLKIELKGPGTVEPTLDLVDRLDMVSQCSFSSFDLERIALVRNLRPQRCPIRGEHIYKTGALFDDLPDNFIEQATAVDADEIHVRYDTCSLPVIDSIHEAGFGSMAWLRGPIGMNDDCMERFWDVGNEDESMFKALLQTGVQQLCVNRPDTLVSLRSNLEKESHHVLGEITNDFAKILSVA